MAYQTLPLDIAGPSAQNKSKQANSELTKNWYAEVTPRGRSDSQLLPWLGSTAITVNASEDRGTHVFKGVLYHVLGASLYSVSTAGVYTLVGSIDGYRRCIFDDNGIEMVIASLGNVYAYDGSTLTKGGADFAASSSVTMLNNQFLYNDTGNQWFVSNAGAALTINGLNFAKAESKGDDLVRPYAFGQWVYFFGTETVEPWWNKGEGNPPFDRLDGAMIEKGLGGAYTIANTDQYLYFLGDDSIVYKIIQSQVAAISTPSIAYQMGKLDASSAEAYTITIDNQDFYVLSFGSANLTFAYSEQLDEWINLSTGVDNGRHIAASYQDVYGKRMAIDYRNGSLIELSDSVYQDCGAVINRTRIFPGFNSSDLGIGAGKRLLMRKAKIMLETGVGIVSGQGSLPQVMMSYSLDGGQTFSTERFINIGQMGDFLVKVEFWEMVSFYDIQLKISISDPVFSALHDASIDIKPAGY